MFEWTVSPLTKSCWSAIKFPIKCKMQLNSWTGNCFIPEELIKVRALLKFSNKHRNKIRLYLLTSDNVIFTRVMRLWKNFQSVRPSIPFLQCPPDTSFSNITNCATDSFTFLYELYVRDFSGNKRALTLLHTFRRILSLWRGKLFTKVTAKKGRVVINILAFQFLIRCRWFRESFTRCNRINLESKCRYVIISAIVEFTFMNNFTGKCFAEK